MAYKVNLSGPAEADAYRAFERIREVAPAGADKWLRGIFAAIATLADMPERCPMIPEADELGHPARHLLYGKRTGQYRIIFDIQEEPREVPRVRILRIWHGSRDALTAADLEEESNSHRFDE
ncbi:MAG: type II toxin-antitoxin system RelE/ParE family toxin [Chloroflexota bacterium]